jgi:dihydrodipicolinate synthase/N-acetylneuraminate lyase
MEMMTGKLGGIIPPTITPFNDAEDLDEAKLQQEIRLLIDAGVHGLSFGGSTGEGALLSDAELAAGIRITKAEVGSRQLPVLCGIIRNSTRQAITAGLAARSAGADCLMVTPTYYHGTSERGNFEYFQAITRATGLPIVIYNVIKTNPILPEAMRKLCEIDGVIGIKQSVGGIHALTDMISACGSKTLVFGAQDDLLFASYLLGAHGAISAILTVFPELCVQQWDAVQAGDLATAKAIHYRILPVWRKIEGGAFPGKIKAALKLMGRPVGQARSPILDATPDEYTELREALGRSGFIQ